MSDAQIIRDKQAKEIACGWHGGGGSALYALCSTGAIADGAVDEIVECMRFSQDSQRSSSRRVVIEAGRDEGRLGRLLFYVQTRGQRGPVERWGKR
jgi:hypothetical protein